MQLLFSTFIGFLLLQEIARNKGSGEEDTVGLDIHAIDELQKKGFPTTNEKSKYDYEADEAGNYGEAQSK